MKFSQLVAIAALLNLTVAELQQHPLHAPHEFAYYKTHPKPATTLAQLSDDDKKAEKKEVGEKKDAGDDPTNKGTGELKDPVVEAKKDKVKEIQNEIDKKTDKEKTDEEKAQEFENKVDDLAKDAEASDHKKTLKALEKKKEGIEKKDEEKAEETGIKKENPKIKELDTKIDKAQKTVDADTSEKAQKKEEASAEDKEVADLKKDKAAAEKEVKKEEATIGDVKSKIHDIVDPKAPEPKTEKTAETDKVKEFMKKAAEEKEKEEKAKEEAEADPPKPNPTVDTVKNVEKSAGAEMDAKVKEAVDTNKEELDKAVKKQESDAAKAKKNSYKPVESSAADPADPSHNSQDEKWTANMPDSSMKASFVQKKISAAIKK